MVQFDKDESTQCAVYDFTPGSEQRKINIIIRPGYTVSKVFSDIATQYHYDRFDLILQPTLKTNELIYLNDCKDALIYKVNGFQPSARNVLILLPTGEWDGNVKKRYPLSLTALKSADSKNVAKKQTSVQQQQQQQQQQPQEQQPLEPQTNANATKTATATETNDNESKNKTKTKSEVASGNKTKTSKKTIIKTVSSSSSNKTNNHVAMNNSKNKCNNKAVNNVEATNPKVVENNVHIDMKVKDDKVEVVGDNVEANENASSNNKSYTFITNTITEATSSLIATPATTTSMCDMLPTALQNPASTPPASGPCSLTDSLNLSPCSEAESFSDDDLALGASASPTETDLMNDGEALTLAQTSSNGSRSKFSALSEEAVYQHISTFATSASSAAATAVASAAVAATVSDDDSDLRPPSEKCRRTMLTTSGSNADDAIGSGGGDGGGGGDAKATASTTSIGYRGLVNQAMTCYLNSLLQALFMTPEFRNALYRWEFDNDNEWKNIPYQLQKLFLNLQTSKKSAVETTHLTRSFGWDSTEAWQQHDIQELCRVMFDALEHKFRNTKQANLISTLYEGKMIDYVKCLECQTEKARIDTFLDIPLPVRPFGSVAAYGSIEEALRAFVQPETLNGNNQYFCEKCNKKCDAHKGLKFKTFPYILTLHLKRFDFDYHTMHRIKLNDKVTFPQTLNLNTFVSSLKESLNDAVTQLNGDDCSTSDSGAAMEEDNCSIGVATTANSSQHENDINDDDEGIDMSSSTDHRINAGSSECAESTCNKRNELTGPYSYELFAIMIHSGSASGGHYYAYIKEFENNEWYCFNDQSVTTITEEDIRKSFGGSASQGYYTSAYTSSTNAYMLMYRQIDAKRNEHSMQLNDLPKHINALLPNLNAEDEVARSCRLNRYSALADLPLRTEQIKPRVYFYNPVLKKLKMTRVYVPLSFSINAVLASAYPVLNVDKFAPIKRCRLVEFDATSEEIIRSFENCNDSTLSAIRSSSNSIITIDFLLEYSAEGQEFQCYEPGGITWCVYVIMLQTMECDGPYLVHSPLHENKDVLRHSIGVRLHIDETKMLLATLKNDKAFVAYDPAPTKEAEELLQTLVKTRLRRLTYLYVEVPKTNPCYLEILGIPAYEPLTNGSGDNRESGADAVDAVLMNGVSAISLSVSSGSIDSRRESPLPPKTTASMTPTPTTATTCATPTTNPQESNSEDSSLSDGDRTLVETVQHYSSSSSGSGGNTGNGDASNSNVSCNTNTHSPQLSSPDDEATRDSYNRIKAYLNQDSNHDTNTSSFYSPLAPFYFHAIELESADGFDTITTASPTSSSHHYNAASSSSAASSSTCNEEATRKTTYKIYCDSHMDLEEFEKHISNLIRVPLDYFKIQRKHGISTGLVSSELLFVHLSDGESLHIELGKALQPDEKKSKIYFMRLSELDNETGRLPCICEWVYKTSMTVAEAKKDIIAKLHRIDAKYETLNYTNCRLWWKGGRNMVTILRNNETLSAVDFLVQECEEGIDPQPPEDSMTLFVRQWHADTMQLDKFQEITIQKGGEIKNALSKLSGLPEDCIAYCEMTNVFPCTTISLLSVNSSISWFSYAATTDNYPLSESANGTVYFYKDLRKAPKELSIEELRDWNVKEKSRLDLLGATSGGVTTSSTYSPRRERALKIYVDSSSTAAPMETTNDGPSTSKINGATIANVNTTTTAAAATTTTTLRH